MRLNTFISENLEVILQAWEDFARDVWPSEGPNIQDLRDHGQEMLLYIIADMQTPKSECERHEKSIGKGQPSESSDEVDSSSEKHAQERRDQGFDLRTLVGEFRALRASVLHLWSQTATHMDATQIRDMMRFNECVDQLLAESVLSYTASIDHSRELFLGILGHDLRTPLCAMTTAAGLLEENAELSGPNKRLASLIGASARAMRTLVADLLDFTGTRLGAKMHLTRQSMDLAQLGNEVLEEIGAEHPSRVFHFEASGEGKGEWDEQRLRQLMSNLLVNAARHATEHTPIRLFLRDGADEVIFGVGNQGPPIPVEARSMIFDPLSRFSEDEMSRKAGSLGLGLYIAREVASAHRGTIEVGSDASETVFTVKLPRTVKNGATKSLTVPAGMPSGGSRGSFAR